MYAHPGAAVEATIEAENLLVLAGLKRIAAQVGIAEAADPATRDLTLRSGTSRSSPFGIDVDCLGLDSDRNRRTTAVSRALGGHL